MKAGLRRSEAGSGRDPGPGGGLGVAADAAPIHQPREMEVDSHAAHHLVCY